MKNEIEKFYTFLENNEQVLKELKNETSGKIKDEKTVFQKQKKMILV